MNKRSTHAREHQTSESPPAAKPACKQHSLWQQIHDLQIPERCDLTGLQTSTLLHLAVRCGMNEKWSWAMGNKALVQEMRYSKTAIKDALKVISKIGLINIDRYPGRSHKNRYTFPKNLAEIVETYEKGREATPLAEPAKTYEKGREATPLSQKGSGDDPEKGRETTPVVDLVDQEGRKDDPNPSFLQLSAAEIDHNRCMLLHDNIAKTGHSLPPPLVDKYAALYKPPVLFTRLCAYLVCDRAQHPGSLKARLLESPENFPPPTLDEIRDDPRYQALDDLAFYEEFGPAFYAESPDTTEANAAAEETGAQVEGEQPAPEIHDDPPAPRPASMGIPPLPPTDMDPMRQLPILDAIQNHPARHADALDLKGQARQRRKEITRARPKQDPQTPVTNPEPDTAAAVENETPPADNPQPDGRLLLRLDQLLTDRPAEVAVCIHHVLQEKIAAIAAKDAPAARTQELMNEAVFEQIQAIEAEQKAAQLEKVRQTTWTPLRDDRQQRMETMQNGRYGKRHITAGRAQ